MSQPVPDGSACPARHGLSQEIGVALAIKVVLLVVLWSLFFRGHAGKASAESTVEGWFSPASASGVSLSHQP